MCIAQLMKRQTWSPGRRILTMGVPPVAMILFAASARPISIPSAKAHVAPLAASASAAKNQSIAALGNAAGNPAFGSGPMPKLTGKRDPFRLPPPPPPPGTRSKLALKPSGPKVDLPPGPGGLLIDQLRLQGIVSENASHRTIAIVTNDNTNRAYFLRPNELVFDGVVSQITPEAIYFRQRLRDAHGRESFREVEKQLIPRKS